MINKALNGSSRRLVFAFDVGTTFSGVSYCILEPGVSTKISTVTRFPGQDNSGCSKVPSVLYYDKHGSVRAAGAEAELDEIVEQAEDEDWLKVQWFKFRLRPRTMTTPVPMKQMTTLPPSKSPTDVLSDFFSYLMTCAEDFIKSAHSDLKDVWSGLHSNATFVLSHPNGWEGSQQAQYRKAAIRAKLVPDTSEGKARVVFVTEGEASLNFCLREGYIKCTDSSGKSGVIVADMGGGTLDFSAYKIVGQAPLRVEEIAAAKCELQGSTFVTERANSYFSNKLRTSEYGHPSTIAKITSAFDRSTKLIFRCLKNAFHSIPFGLHTDKDVSHSIRSGRLRVQAEEVAGFFDPSVKAAINAILDQVNEAPIPVTAVYLVGGFSANPYLVSQLKEQLLEKGIKVYVPDGQTIKAVAEGSISYYVDHYVTSRVAKVSYVTELSLDFDPNNVEHVKRIDCVTTWPSGDESVHGALGVILRQGTVVKEETEFREIYYQENFPNEINMSAPHETTIYSYNGSTPMPRWKDETDFKSLREVCVVSVPRYNLIDAMHTLLNNKGDAYVICSYSIIMHFGGPELKAQLAWEGKNGEQRSPIEIFYNDDDDDDVEEDYFAEFSQDEIGALSSKLAMAGLGVESDSGSGSGVML